MEQINQNIKPEQTTKSVSSNSFRWRAYSTIRKILIGFILISIANIIFSQLFYTPKIHNINRKNSELIIKYGLLNNRIVAAESKLSEIAHRNDHVYRSLFGIDSAILVANNIDYPASKYQHLQGEPYSPIMVDSWQRIDKFARELYSSSLSFDELQILAKNKEGMSAALPAIWPIDRNMLNSISQFGMRFHPLYHRYIHHSGIDLGSKRGTPVFATGDGVVEKSVQGQQYKGYGQEILIDHGYSYKTRYAHLNKRYIEKGDTVKRGQLIGEVGSTGGTDGPHLHYEVLIKNIPVNPINYLDRNMTNEEYTRLTEDIKPTEFERVDSLENGN